MSGLENGSSGEPVPLAPLEAGSDGSTDGGFGMQENSIATRGDPRQDGSDEESEDGYPAGGERTVLEGFARCSESLLWKLMMSFYDRKGPESWSQGIVPHFITCNAFIGRSYAKVRGMLSCTQQQFVGRCMKCFCTQLAEFCIVYLMTCAI
jgi:hypothetical protein